jgi:Tfp pilus assembly protein FimT
MEGYPMKKGMSLIEALVLLLILGILLQAGALSFHQMEPRYRLQAAVWEILSQLNHARFRAILDGTAVRVKFSPGSYALEEWDPEQKTWGRTDVSMIQGVQMSANNAPVFYPEGTVSNLATITLSNATGGFKITLAISGRIKATRIS